MKNDFKKNKTKNNIIGLLLTGQGSGIGQVLSGIVCLIISVVVLYMQTK